MKQRNGQVTGETDTGCDIGLNDLMADSLTMYNKTQCYLEDERAAMQPNSRNTVTVTFSLPPETAQNLQQVAGEEQRTVSELLREAIRLYMEEREWRIEERRQRRRSRRDH